MKTICHQAQLEKPIRLDKFLAQNNLATSRSEASDWIQNKCVTVNGEFVKASYAVQNGDEIQIQKPSLKTLDLTPHKVDFEIVYEDDDLLVINKPAGLVVHPGPGNYETSLVHGLLYHCGKSLSGIGGVERPGIVHRLDKGTSGLMLVAKSDKAHQALTKLFQNRLIEKKYRALALYEMQKTQQTLKDLMKRSETNRKKFVVNSKKGKEAITHVSVLKKNKLCSYVEVKIDTGRTHQIRVHLKAIHHPIMGDETYGGTQKLKGFAPDDVRFIKDLGRPLLHSFSLSFEHPVQKKNLQFEKEVPEDFQKALTRFLS